MVSGKATFSCSPQPFIQQNASLTAIPLIFYIVPNIEADIMTIHLQWAGGVLSVEAESSQAVPYGGNDSS